MMTKTKITYEGQPLEVLNALIRRRSQQLKQHIGNAVAATMINVLRSVRSDTRNALNTKRFNIEVQDTGWYGGFDGNTHKRVVREGVSRYAKQIPVDGKVTWFTWDNPKQAQTHVYKVTNERGETYYAGARTAQIVLDNELRRIAKRINHYGGVAQNCYSVAMNKIARTTIPQDGSKTSKQKASNLSNVRIVESNGIYNMTVESQIDYATEALKSGPNAIDIAMMKAANKTAGIINKFAGKNLREEIVAPFPEVKQRR